jgi:hypothetical protein
MRVIDYEDRLIPERACETYLIHDNMKPHLQVVIEKLKRDDLLRRPDPFGDDIDSVKASIYHYFTATESKGPLIKSITAKKAFIGKMTSPNKELLGNDYYDGNTILLQISDDKFVYIGEYIYEFKLQPEDVVDNSVRNYYSYVDNSDCPTPVFACTNNIYFLCENTFIARDKLPPNLSATEEEEACEKYYYRRNNPDVDLLKPFMHRNTDIKIIHLKRGYRFL